MANKKPLANYSGAIKELQSGDKIAMGDLEYDIQSGSIIYAADAEASDAYAITLNPVPTAYTNGMVVHFKANTANTGACTLNVNSLGAKTIKKNYDSDLADNDIKAGQLVSVIYDGTNFQMLSPIANAATGTTKQVAYLTSNFTVNNIVYMDITGLSGTVSANKKYRVTGNVYFNCAQNGSSWGATLRLSFPTAYSSGYFTQRDYSYYFDSNVNKSRSNGTTCSLGSICSPGLEMVCIFDILFEVGGSGGTIKLQGQASYDGDQNNTSTIYAGAILHIEELP